MAPVPLRTGGFLTSCSRKGGFTITGFLPGWLAAAALVICTGKIAEIVGEEQAVPGWLLLVAVLLAVGTLP
jgi:hypothetical protein